MTQLSTHFNLSEFQKGDPIPEECIPIFRELCEQILEPIRVEFGKPLIITSGYRSEKQNAEAHGQETSEHIASPTKCAVDFFIEGIGMRFAFDWCRNNPILPFHQLILESGPKGGSIIHCSINRMMPGIRSVLTGATHNTAPYQKVDYVAYIPPQQISG